MTPALRVDPRLAYVGHRLIQVVPVALAIIVINFFLLRLAPGDLADVMAGEAGAATPEYMAALRHQFGTDTSVTVQFVHYFGRILTLDLGYSFRNGESVLTLILDRLPATALLLGPSLIIAVFMGCVLGWASAVNRWADQAITILTTAAFATPIFCTGLMLIVVFSIQHHWLPTGGIYDMDAGYTGFDAVFDVARHMVMPVSSLAIFYLAIYTRVMRSAIIEVSGLDFVRTAQAKGLTRLRITLAHVVRNALLPVVTMVGLQLGSLLGGAVVVETIFSWPGMGRLAFEAITQRDLNLMLGILFCTSLLVILVNLATDLVYAALDPRIELR